MAKTKRTKPSKKPTTKGKDLPESVQWLLDFANIGSKPGNVSHLRIWGNSPVKRPPSEPAALRIVFLDTRSLVEEVIRLDEKQFFEELATGGNKDDIEIMRSTFELFRFVNNLALIKTRENTDGLKILRLNKKLAIGNFKDGLEIMRSNKKLAIGNFKDDIEIMRSTYEVFRAAIIPRKEYYLKNRILWYSDVNGNQLLSGGPRNMP